MSRQDYSTKPKEALQLMPKIITVVYICMLVIGLHSDTVVTAITF